MTIKMYVGNIKIKVDDFIEHVKNCLQNNLYPNEQFDTFLNLNFQMIGEQNYVILKTIFLDETFNVKKAFIRCNGEHPLKLYQTSDVEIQKYLNSLNNEVFELYDEEY